ncbi:MAG TPA: phospholipase D-like domain-containing protein, partial [Planctomycetota bacterium]|nr:phospholipase D-like domain-containing protein [Planctomycetota bacterium]
PDLSAALCAASLRGVDVRVLVPGRNNQPIVAWASRALAPELLERGVRIAEQPPPFAHTKGAIFDDAYGLVGSHNIDPRSLRLNFELGLEVFDAELVGRLAGVFVERWERSREWTLPELAGLSLGVRIRDNLARLASPYL